jgi:hypothetical protein
MNLEDEVQRLDMASGMMKDGRELMEVNGLIASF